MKRRIRKTLSLALALIMLLSMVPLVYAAEDADEFAGLETLEEIPFEFVLEPGDLPYELLREAVLDVRDIPDCIDPALAEERGHVNRLYLQEPDDCTVMFQNRDGSKTIYLFSHPVKGMTASTVATVQINGTSVSFSGENAVTSRLAEITNFNIGSAEIAYLPVGVLSENGVNITEDVRSWTLAESIDVAQAYNISSEAAAEYAASVAVPETDAAATAAVAPGITITPNDPAPLGGMTVMSISYSDLAGAMRFKNVSTNKYLTFSNSSLTVSTSFQLKYSEWVVQYDSFFGYVVSNLSDPYNTYIGYDDTETFMIDTLSYMMYAIEPVIVSTSASTVRLQCSLSAIDSNAQMYELSPSESNYPDSCTWQIMNKRNIRLVTSISVPTTIVEQSGVGFIYSNRYSFPQPYPTYYEIELYDATTNQPFNFDTKIYEDDEYWCAINTPGIYTAYYKDNVTGVRSKCFALVIVDSMPASDNNLTYTIQPINNSGLYLTMEANTKTVNSDTVYQADSNTILLTTMSTGTYEELDDISRTFVIEQYSYGFNISATLPTLQYLGVPEGSSIDNVSTYNPNYVVDYSLTKLTDQNNALNYSDGIISTKNYTSSGSDLGLYPITVADAEENEYYYIIVCGASNDGVLALKYNSSTNYSVEVYTPGQNGFVWKFTQVGVNAPLIKQTTNFWCGYTTALQCLYGKEIFDANEEGLNLHEKIGYVADLIGSKTSDASRFVTYSNMISEWNSDASIAANCMTVDYPNYSCQISETQARQRISDSLEYGWCPIFLTKQGGLPYKEGSTTYHYICIIGFDPVSDRVIIANCHYNNDIFGIYSVNFSSFYDAIAILYWVE